MNDAALVLRDSGTNSLIGGTKDEIAAAVEAIMHDPRNRGTIPELWDGHTAERTVQLLNEYVSYERCGN